MNGKRQIDRLRTAINKLTTDAVETNRADADLTALSYHSKTHSARHVWVELADSKEIVIDLEDWTDDTAWDNTVKQKTVQTVEQAAQVVHDWLSGVTS